MTTNVVGEEPNRVEFQAAKEMTKAQSYAAFLVKLAKERGALDAVDQDLRLLKTTISGHLNLKNALTDVGVPMERKQKVIEEIFSGKVSAAILNFLSLLSDLGQVKMLPQIAEEFARRLEAVEKKVIAEVTTAIPLEPEITASISKQLAALAGREVTIRSKVDPDIVGGIVVRMGGKLLDGSVCNQLERLRHQMLIDIRGR